MYSAASGTATGVTTPHTAASLRPLNLSYGPLDYTLLVSTGAYFSASLVRDEFLATLPLPSEELAGDHEPASVAELLSRFLGFLAKKSDEEGNQFDDVLNLVLNEFELRFLNGNDVHVLATNLQDTSDQKRLGVIRDYYAARLAANRPLRSHQSALLQAGLNGKAIVQAIFGGQGNTEEYFDEIRQLYSVYKPFLEDILQIWADKLLVLAQNDSASKLFPKGLDLMQWLKNPETTPDLDYMVNAPASLPLIAVSQFAHYAVTCSVLGLSPGQFRDILSGATGHSQGIITAVAIASSGSWDSFVQETIKALTTLFWIGVRSQQDYPRTALAPSILQDSVAHAEGRPTPMLAINSLTREQVDNHIKITNEHLPKNRHVGISLVNGPRSFIVSGPPQTLYGLNLSLRKLKADKKGDQNRVPHSQRKLKFTNRFLPITAPFHSPYLLNTTQTILDDLQGISFELSNLAIPVFDTYSGLDLRSECTDSESLLDRLVNLITNLPVHWQAATSSKATHILDFGPGGASGLGVLTHKNKEGSGVRIIIATALEGSFNEVGYMAEIFDREVSSLVYAQNWVQEFSPKLIKNSKGHTFVDTKFSRLLGQPPIMVAGMTPTTVPADFVAATMNAGYHIELAGGGYFNAPGMTKALEYIENHTTPGDGITVNLIYVNPVMMQWAIPLLRQLRAKGVPIEGLTIGAGVPSLEVAKEYIETLGLRYLGLKPGSIDAIYRCISIAKDNPKFPIVVQWTGGRAGGHHSYEDFHYAILQTYSKLRRCDNIILVIGSGFGGADDTYPYLTGEWSVTHDHPPMPFDGVLFGSRMMTAKEAHTSHGAKLAIKDAPGVKDSEWEKSYEGPIGGVVTVLSEMGEPIHKLATRGVMFWRELDNTIFNLPKAKRVPALLHKKDYIVKKLNADFQKPWFGRKSDGQVCDIDDMTYIEILNRLVELMFVKKENRWIDLTLRNFTGNFIRRIEERFAHNDSQVSILQSFTELDSPYAVIEKVAKSYPLASSQLINAQDKDYFLNLTMNRAQKPVPFVPVLDDNFEFYFKKDSLWQSEDLAAVVGEDVQRTCILQGPVAARYSTEIDVPVKDILDSIHNGHIANLLKQVYHGDASRIPVIEYFGDAKPAVKLSFETLTITEEKNSTLYQLDESAAPQNLPDVDSWLRLLGGSTPSWRHAFFNASVFVQGRKYVTNPLKNILAPSPGLTVQVTNPQDIEKTRYSVIEKINGKNVTTVTIDKDGETITLTLYEERSASGRAVGLPLLFNYHPEQGFAPIHEIVESRNDRIKRFYWRLWFGDTEPFEYGQVDAEINGGTATVTGKDIADFVLAVGNRGEAFVERPGKVTYAPMDFAIVVGWKAIIKAIFPKVIDGDLLELVHLSNSFKMVGGAAPLKEGDVVSTKANINAVINQDAGKLVEVSAVLYREKEPVMEIVSQFLYRGTYNDFDTTFQRKKEAPIEINFKTSKDVAVFKAKEWVDLDDPDLDLLDKILTFRLETVETYRNQKVYSSVKTTGQILLELPTKEVIQIGSVDYEAGTCHGNPVIDYLQRWGTTIEQPVLFENAIPLNNGTELVIKAPASNEPYANVSGDFNPIHVSRAFSKYANLPGTITHGMYSSAAIRSQVEVWAAENHIARVRAFTCSFVGMVLPNDDIEINLHHVGMINGRKIVKVEAVKKETQETVISGEAEIDQPVSTYMFTGQGSQEQGMGMDLYNSSPVAKDVWDRADRHFLNNFGFSIINIVKNNPKKLTVYFGGERGKAIRHNYTSMIFESVDADGKVRAEKIFKEIDENSTSYTFKSPTGLLSATQFTQPALTLMEKASFEDMKSKGLVASNSSFAGHSLGEYSALASLGDVMPIESLVDVVFYRGMTMQVAVPRDSHGRSNYGMCAVNPSRVSPSFNDAALRYVVDFISEKTQWLLEIVNYNVENTQYVTAGDLRALDTLTNVLNFLKVKKIDLDGLIKSMPMEKVGEHLSEIVSEIAAKSEAKPQPIDLERGFAVIPLKGISVPFHSSYLRNGVKPFHRFLEKRIPKSAIKPANLIDRYIPNLTAKPFEITKEYFQDVYDLTGSARVKNILDNWDTYEQS